MRFAPAIVANLVVLLAAIGYGSVLRPLFPCKLSRIDRIVLVPLCGLGLLGTLLFLVGQLWFTRGVILAFLLPAIWGAMVVARRGREAFAQLGQLRPPLLPLAIVGLVFALTAVGGLNFPTGDISTMGLKNDAIAYHFLGPRVWLRDKVIHPVPDESMTAMPAIVETDYCALISIGGPRAPEFFAVVQLAILLLIAAGIAMRLGLNGLECWWVVALIATMPVVTNATTGGRVDAVYGVFVLAALRVVFDLESRSAWILLGILGGFAMGAKYTGIIAWALLLVCALAATTIVLKLNWRAALKHIAVATVVAGCVAAPWYIRNWAMLGNPMYPSPPLLSHLFHTSYMSEQTARRFQAEIWREGNGMGRSLWAFVMLPFHLTVHPANFLDGVGGFGIVPLALGPFAILVFWRSAWAKVAGLFAALQTFVWFVTCQDGRYFIHVLILVAIAGVAGWRYVRGIAPRMGQALACVVVAISVSYGLFMIVQNQRENIHSVLSKRFEEQRRRTEIPFAASFRYLNANPSVTRVLFLNPYVPSYYSQKDYIKPFGRWGEQVLPNATTTPEVLSELGRLHVSDILDVNWAGINFEVPPNMPGLKLVFSDKNQRVYRVVQTANLADAQQATREIKN